MAGGPGGHYVDAYGNPAIIPASYCGPGYPGAGYGGPMGGYGEVPDLFGGAGAVIEQTGPHYFDISGEFLYWKRDELGSRFQAFTALGTSIDPSVTNIVQSTDSIDPDFEPGFRIFGRYDIGPLAVLEVGYTGLLNQTENSVASATVIDDISGGGTGEGNLFSPFSNFGVSFLVPGSMAAGDANPFAGGISAPSGPGSEDLDVFDDTDRALSHTLSYDSNLQSAEVNYRRYWVGFSPRLSGTLLVGFRYTRLDEEFGFSATGIDFAPGTPAGGSPVLPLGTTTTASYSVNADNDLLGFQIGGDASYAVRQGIRILAEGKAGLFNNDINLTTSFSTTDGTPDPFSESFSDNQVAFISDARLAVVIDVLPSLSIKAGYELLFLNSIATAVDNINLSGIPAGVTGVAARTTVFEDQGDALYHGAHLGVEYVW
ncbi:MAG: Lpg1974 family pore-forming outer membrane protein [Planctomycetota bacterium]